VRHGIGVAVLAEQFPVSSIGQVKVVLGIGGSLLEFDPPLVEGVAA
jgi:hypothetical protein